MYSGGQKKASLNFFKYLRNGRSDLSEIWNLSSWQARRSPKNFWKRHVNISAHTTQNVNTRVKSCAHVLCAHVFTRNFMKMVLIVQNYVMTLSFKFHKDLIFCCGDIRKIILNMHPRGIINLWTFNTRARTFLRCVCAYVHRSLQKKFG